MKTRYLVSSSILLLLLVSSPHFAQNTALPRDDQKLVARARLFWSNITAGKKLAAAELVLPEKRDAFLASASQSPLKAEVIGIDLTGDPTKAVVRVLVATVVAGAFANGPASITVHDRWALKGNTWYADVGNIQDLLDLGAVPPGSGPSANQMQKEIDAALRLPQNTLDIGTLVQGENRTFKLPVAYSGKYPLRTSPVVASEFIQVGSPKDLTKDTAELDVYVNTSNKAGEFTVPVLVDFGFEAAHVQRTVIVKGSVFVPFTFRQVPPSGPIASRQVISLFVRNNTPSAVALRDVYAPEFEILNYSASVVLAPGVETEFVLQLKPTEAPKSFVLLLAAPIGGLVDITYRFQTGP